jgi:septal ring factor EnvC (AmiA/AmiB activator)
VEELTDILVGLEQRISAYKNRLQELEKKRRRLDDEIATIKKYLELAETLYRVEADKAKLASLSSQFYSDEKGARQRPNTDVTDQSREILMGRSKYSGKSVSGSCVRNAPRGESLDARKRACAAIGRGGAPD